MHSASPPLLLTCPHHTHSPALGNPGPQPEVPSALCSLPKSPWHAHSSLVPGLLAEWGRGWEGEGEDGGRGASVLLGCWI